MLVIYTVDFAGRDEKFADTHVIEDAQYICFTDRPEAVDYPWEPRRPRHYLMCPRMTSLWHKTHSHVILPKHDHSIFLNAGIGLLKDPTPEFKAGFGLQRHRHRNDLFEEARFCRDIGIMTPEDYLRQTSYYLSRVGKRPSGLWESGALIRDSGRRTAEVNEAWWDHIQRFSNRDQVSLAFLNSLSNFIYDVPGDFDNPEYFHLTPHGGPLPVDPAELRERFPGYWQRKKAWEESVKQLSLALDDAEPPV